MDEKTEERIALEQKAQDLGVSFAPNIGDEKLAERVAKAEAEAAKAKNTQGVEEVAKTAQSPADAPEESETAQVGEAAKPGLSDTAAPKNTQGADDASKDAEARTEAAELAATTGGEQQTDLAGEAPIITVICLRPDGRRRAGRRWDEGETLVPEDELTAFQIAVLEADPQFIVKREG
ncbi:HI1506-related protein [Salipiger abyssi]|uniref:Uncharacterized protein n=1 Tax=Salipiger abyssi TaxID=1250539 RepID=A0A1P8UXK3_9RHOB|nr:HI1506-related protein [Salipiger abyssi]ALF02106.1 hypothetical protein vBPeaSP1_015 [Pelagibaca phage vB_PeaS-P1]APZ54121.1 hypothetical protein Ga0080574_TMP3787 [Salipiger abyssi]